MLSEIIIQQLNQLKLTGMVQAFHERLAHPAMQDLSFNEQFAMLIDREIVQRKNTRISNLLRLAKLRQQASIENVDYRHNRQLDKSQFMSLASCDFIRQQHNLIMTGSTGCGKSYLACVIGNQACRLGFSVQYLSVPRLLEELTIAHADGSYGKMLVQLAKKDLVILDDFGMAPVLTSQQHRDLFNLIDDRHQIKSTLITSQLPVKNWHDYIGEPTAADAILDRLLQNAHRIELKGESMRKAKMTKIVD